MISSQSGPGFVAKQPKVDAQDDRPEGEGQEGGVGGGHDAGGLLDASTADRGAFLLRDGSINGSVV